MIKHIFTTPLPLTGIFKSDIYTVTIPVLSGATLTMFKQLNYFMHFMISHQSFRVMSPDCRSNRAMLIQGSGQSGPGNAVRAWIPNNSNKIQNHRALIS